MKKSLLIFLVVFFFLGKGTVQAAPHFELNPSTKSVKVGDIFDVKIVAKTGDLKVSTFDVVLNFNTSLLEITDASLESSVNTECVKAGATLPCLQFVNLIENSKGKFAASIYHNGAAVPTNDRLVNGDVLNLKVKAKAVGTATLTYACTQSSSSGDSNIFDSTSSSLDKTTCSENINGTYTITASAVSPTTAPASSSTTTGSSSSTTVVATATPRPTSLPESGNLEVTLGLIFVGAVSVLFGGYIMKL